MGLYGALAQMGMQAYQAKKNNAATAAAQADQLARQNAAAGTMDAYRQTAHDARLAGMKSQMQAYNPLNRFMGSPYGQDMSTMVQDPFAGTNWQATGLGNGSGGAAGDGKKGFFDKGSPFASPSDTSVWLANQVGVDTSGWNIGGVNISDLDAGANILHSIL